MSASHRAAPVPLPPTRRRRRDEAGLTTLEWLLITAAVAAFAAIAVVLVRENVETQAERIASSEAPAAAAHLLAVAVEDDSKTADPAEFDTWAEWEHYFTRRCARIAITHGAGDIRVVANSFNRPVGAQTYATPTNADHTPPSATKAQAHCAVNSN